MPFDVREISLQEVKDVCIATACNSGEMRSIKQQSVNIFVQCVVWFYSTHRISALEVGKHCLNVITEVVGKN